MSHKTRTTLYGFVLAFGLIETAMGLVSAVIPGFSNLLIIFGNIVGGFALATWIWVSVLLSYNNRPTSTHVLTRAYVHIYSFLSFVPIWLAMGILIFTQLPAQCNFKRDSDGEAGVWCGITASVGGFAIIICILSGASAFIIRKQCSGMNSHVCSGDGPYAEISR